MRSRWVETLSSHFLLWRVIGVMSGVCNEECKTVANPTGKLYCGIIITPIYCTECDCSANVE